MAEAGVNGVVTADVLTELSNDTVLTTEWINGGCKLGGRFVIMLAQLLHVPVVEDRHQQACHLEKAAVKYVACMLYVPACASFKLACWHPFVIFEVLSPRLMCLLT
jgi:hypothetical protein